MIYFLPGDFWIRFKLCTLLFHSTLELLFRTEYQSLCAWSIIHTYLSMSIEIWTEKTRARSPSGASNITQNGKRDARLRILPGRSELLSNHKSSIAEIFNPRLVCPSLGPVSLNKLTSLSVAGLKRACCDG